LIQGLDFDMEPPQGWMQDQDIEVLVVDLGLSEEQLNKIMDYRAQMQKKAVKIAKKMEAYLQTLEAELQKDTPDDKKVNKAVMGLVDQGIALLNSHADHRLKAKDVLTVEQKKQLLHALFIAAGF
jgi:Spy/CpxP family protein refolding chaperone